MRPRRLRRLLVLSAFGAILTGSLLGAGAARAACEVVTVTTSYVPQHDWGYWVSLGVSVVLAAAIAALVVYLFLSFLRRSQ